MIMYLRPEAPRRHDIWVGRSKKYPTLKELRSFQHLLDPAKGVLDYIKSSADWRQHDLAYAVLVEVSPTLQLVYKVCAGLVRSILQSLTRLTLACCAGRCEHWSHELHAP